MAQDWLVINDEMYRLVLTNTLASSQNVVDESELANRLAGTAFPVYN